MSEDLGHHPDALPWAPSPRVRIVLGLLAGVGSTGITVGVGLIGAFLDVDQYRPPLDLSGPILVAPLIIVPGFAAAVLRGRAAVIAITLGATASPIGASLFIEGPCLTGVYLMIGLAMFAMFALFFAGLSALAGAWIGGSRWFERDRLRGAAALVVVGTIGLIVWIPSVASLRSCV